MKWQWDIAVEKSVVQTLILIRHILQIDCNVVENGLQITPNSPCVLDTPVIDELLEYKRLYD